VGTGKACNSRVRPTLSTPRRPTNKINNPYYFIRACMQTIEVTSNIFRFHIPEYNKIKPFILKEIENTTSRSSYVKGEESISNTDWYTSTEVPRTYMNILKPYLDEFLEELSNEVYQVNKGHPLVLDNFWFQQYKKGDFHTWHHHGECNYSSIYFVELPSNTATQFQSFKGVTFKVPVQEGDYIIFPSSLLHQSAPNPLRERKTVIPINLNATY
jgi:hypothetical protein